VILYKKKITEIELFYDCMKRDSVTDVHDFEQKNRSRAGSFMYNHTIERRRI